MLGLSGTGLQRAVLEVKQAGDEEVVHTNEGRIATLNAVPALEEENENLIDTQKSISFHSH